MNLKEKIETFSDGLKQYIGFWDVTSRENINRSLEPYYKSKFFSFILEGLPTRVHSMARPVGFSMGYGALILAPANQELAIGLGYCSGFVLLLDKLSMRCAIQNREKELAHIRNRNL